MILFMLQRMSNPTLRLQCWLEPDRVRPLAQDRIGEGLAKPAEELLVALEARCSHLRSLLISGVQCAGAEVIARTLVVTARAAGRQDIYLTTEAASLKTDNGTGLSESFSIPFEGVEAAIDVSRLKRSIREVSRDRMLVFSTSDFANCAESSSLAASVDGVVLVVEAQRTTKTGLTEVRDRLSTLNACLIGFVYADRQIA
jgi:hypothetical protein